MKRLTKLFTLLLAICLLLGVVAISAAAVKSEDAIADHIAGQYTVSGVSNYKTDTEGTTDWSESSQLGKADGYVVCAADSATTVNGNTYRRFYNIGEGSMASDKITSVGYFNTSLSL